jgi:hypothetical protein
VRRKVAPLAGREIVVFGEALDCVFSTTLSPHVVERPSEGGYQWSGVATRGGL